MDASTARRKSAGVRGSQTVKAKAMEKAKEKADKKWAKELGALMIERLEVKIEEAIAEGSDRALECVDEDSRFVQSMAFYDHIVPHFELLGYKLEWEYKDDYDWEERGRVTFFVTLTW